MNRGFLDLLFNGLLSFVMLFAISFILIKPTEDPGGLESKAEYLIRVTWPPASDADVDLWIEDPFSNLCFFKHKETPFMHLDRDDLGDSNDIYTDVNGRQHIISFNQEIATVRHTVEGEWLVNIHMYNMREQPSVDIFVEIVEVNPVIRKILAENINISVNNEEVHVARLLMNKDGKFVKMTKKPVKSIIAKAVRGDFNGTSVLREE